MPFDPLLFPICREPDCNHTAGPAGYCPTHLTSALSRRTLNELVDMLEEVIEGLVQEREAAYKPAPLLN